MEGEQTLSNLPKDKLKGRTGMIYAVFIAALVIMGIYIVSDEVQERQDAVYAQGIKEGVDIAVAQLIMQSSDCQIMTLSMGNESIQLVDVSCIRQG